MKRFLVFALVLALIVCVFPLNAFASGISVSAEAAVLLCADNGKVLFERNSHSELPMASTTKIMTALITLEQNTPDKKIVTTEEMVSVEGTSMGLRVGDTVDYYTLVCGMLLASGNDAANTAAVCIAGSVSAFSDIMNEKAKSFGMNNTHFVTPSGLDSDGHYSSAYDMALLACQAIKNEQFRSICSSESIAVYYGNPPYRRVLTNHNRLLKEVDGVFGIKTGFTKKSGRCLVTAAERDGVTLVAVTLNASDDWNDHKKLLEYGFKRVKRIPLDDDFTEVGVRVTGGNNGYISVKCEEIPSFVGTGEEKVTRTVFVEPFVYAPINVSQKVGTACYYSDGELVCSVDLLSCEKVESKHKDEKSAKNKKSFFERIKEFFRRKYG